MSAALARMAAGAGLLGAHRRARGQVGRRRAPSGGTRTSATRRSCSHRPRSLPTAGRPGTVRARTAHPRRRAAWSTSRTTACGGCPSGWSRSGVVDVVSTAIPGIRDVLVLGKIKQLEREAGRRPDRGRRAGHRPRHDVPTSAERAGRAPPAAGRCAAQAAATWSTSSTDPARCRVVLVTLPEEHAGLARRSSPPTHSRTRRACSSVRSSSTPATPCRWASTGRRPRWPPRQGSTWTPDHAGRPRGGPALPPGPPRRLQAEQVERLGRELPLPQLLVPAARRRRHRAGRARLLADALAGAVAGLATEGAA